MKPNSITRPHTRLIIGIFSTAVLAACSNSPAGPGEHTATMQVGASSVTATALGQSVTIQASVVDGSGSTVSDPAIRWDLSSADVLESLGNGSFRVLKEGNVTVAAVWLKDSSVRAAVTVNVNAGLLASACITRSDQSAQGAAPKCAQQRVVVRTAPVPASVVASATSH